VSRIVQVQVVQLNYEDVSSHVCESNLWQSTSEVRLVIFIALSDLV